MFKPKYIINDKVKWTKLSKNPNAIHILEQNLDKVSEYYFSGIPNTDYIDKFYWTQITYINAIHTLDKVNWSQLSENPYAIHILEKNLDKVDWEKLSSNLNAIHILEKNLHRLDKHCWSGLSKNPNAIHLLAPLDKEYMKNQIDEFKQELVAYVFHPTRLMKYCDKYGIDYHNIDEIY